jgi:hypothetical protein
MEIEGLKLTMAQDFFLPELVVVFSVRLVGFQLAVLFAVAVIEQIRIL